MDYVPVKESIHQWEQYFSEVNRGNKSSNFNDIPLEPDVTYVEGVPASVLDKDGNLTAPKIAANVTAPKDKPISLPDSYKVVVSPETAQEEDEMARRRSYKKRKTSSKPRKRIKRVYRRKKAGAKHVVKRKKN